MLEQSKQSLELCNLLDYDRGCVCHREQLITEFETVLERFHRSEQAGTDDHDLRRNWRQRCRAPASHETKLATRAAHVMN